MELEKIDNWFIIFCSWIVKVSLGPTVDDADIEGLSIRQNTII